MQTLLERKDRMSMGASLEVRVPFADHELVEYVWNIPWALKRLAGKKKAFYEKRQSQKGCFHKKLYGARKIHIRKLIIQHIQKLCKH